MEITKCSEDNLRQDDNPHLYVRKQCFAYVKKSRRTPRTGRSWQAVDDSKMSRGQTDSWFVATSDFCSKVGKQFTMHQIELSISKSKMLHTFYHLT